jgi:hypothetical protein
MKNSIPVRPDRLSGFSGSGTGPPERQHLGIDAGDPQSTAQGPSLDGQGHAVGSGVQIGATSGCPLGAVDHDSLLPDQPDELGLSCLAAAADAGAHRLNHAPSLPVPRTVP